MRRVVVGDPFPGVMSGPARPAACPRAGWAASNRWAGPSPAAIRSAATPPAANRGRPGLPQRQPLVDRRGNVLFFGLNTGVLAILLWAVTVAATLTGLVIGRRVARSATGLSEHFGVLQGALIGFMGLVLAFGLSLALGRYESRRADTLDEANAIGTAYLRAQTLAEPVRTERLAAPSGGRGGGPGRMGALLTLPPPPPRHKPPSLRRPGATPQRGGRSHTGRRPSPGSGRRRNPP